MKFVALVSGGKDSIYSILEATKLGHDLVACVHLGRPRQETEESYMYQTAGSEALTVLVEESLGVPLILHERVGKSLNTSLVYDGVGVGASNLCPSTEEIDNNDQSTIDEVEDLYQALLKAQQQFPGIQAVSSGAILSTYQRVRIENVCSRLGLTSLSYLWRRDTQHNLLQNMIDAGMEAVLVRVAAPPGLTARHLTKSLRQLQPLFHSLHDKYQFSVCGEGGEYESLVLDCPLYKKRLVFDETEVVELENDGVAVLRIVSCHAEAKGVASETLSAPIRNASSTRPTEPVANDKTPQLTTASHGLSVTILPRVCRASGGLFHVSEVMAPAAARIVSGKETESDLAVEEALAVFAILSKVLAYQGATTQDVMMVHLYLSEMSHFAAINQHYRNFFGTMLPPSRSCIGLGSNRLPGGRRILLDCVVQCGSGQYMRSVAAEKQDLDNHYAKNAAANTYTQLRQVLHVQSISYWAPVCVGPYSQGNTFRGAVIFVAGQIGLQPETMTLRRTWTEQLVQAWTNAASVLDAVKSGSLEHMISGLVYVASHVFLVDGALDKVEEICYRQRSNNGGVYPGAIDDIRKTTDFHGYEDEGTMIECMDAGEGGLKVCPLLVIAVPEMPVGALVEVEIVAASSVAASSCTPSVSTGTSCCKRRHLKSLDDQWTGYEPPLIDELHKDAIQIDACWFALGYGVLGTALVTASISSSNDELDLDAELVFGSMIDQLSRLSQSSALSPDILYTLHLRLFYVTSTPRVDDATSLRSAFVSAVSACFGCADRLPSVSVIPVEGLHTIGMQNIRNATDKTIVYAIQAGLVMDPLSVETELWIRALR